MKKRTLAIILIVLVVLAGLWLAREQTVRPEESEEAQTTSCLIALDEVQQQTAASASAANEPTPSPTDGLAAADDDEQAKPNEHGSYTTKEEVSAYLAAYGRLPENFISKEEARALGWSGGGLDDYAYGKCIGGDRFGNYEGFLPESSGRVYFECDIDTLHQNARGAKRIVFSSDGLIYYTDDHYQSFTLLYGEP